MTNLKIIERPQLFQIMNDYMIVCANESLKIINTIKAVIKEAVTLKDSKESNPPNSIIKPSNEKTFEFYGKEFTLKMINYEIDVLAMRIEYIRDEICFEEEGTPAGSYNQRLHELECKLITLENDMGEILSFKKFYV
jgi:hypothetical protein